MLIRVAPDLSELVVCADRAEQENILGAGRGTAEPLAVWRCERPALLTDTARISQLEPGRRDAVLSLYESYPRTVTYDGTSVGWSPNRVPEGLVSEHRHAVLRQDRCAGTWTACAASPRSAAARGFSPSTR